MGRRHLLANQAHPVLMDYVPLTPATSRRLDELADCSRQRARRRRTDLTFVGHGAAALRSAADVLQRRLGGAPFTLTRWHVACRTVVWLMPDTHTVLVPDSDEALARRVAGGLPGLTDAEEAELYRRFAPRVRLNGSRHLRNDAAADDLAQDVLLLTIERLRAGEVRRPEEIGSFILGTSRMRAHSEHRIARRREALAARFIDTVVETAPISITAFDVLRVAPCQGAR